VWAVGFQTKDSAQEPLAVQWNGAAWSEVATADPGSSSGVLDGVAASASGNVWAVGISHGGTTYETLAERWDGSTWTSFESLNPSGDSQFLAVDVEKAPGVRTWAVGRFLGPDQETLAEGYFCSG
jgi:hypothetical protein